MGHSLKVELTDLKETYSLDDVIEGKVVADFAKSIDVDEVVFKVKCLATVDIVFSNNTHDISTDKIFYVEKRVFPPAEVSDAVSSKTFTVLPGHYEWPVSVDLAQFSDLVVPPSSSGSGGSFSDLMCFYDVTFSYKAVIHRSSRWRRNIRDTHFAKLLPCVDLDYLDSAPTNTMESSLEFKIPDRDIQKTTTIFNRTPKCANCVLAKLHIPAVIPQAPRCTGLGLHITAEKEVQVDKIELRVHERLYLSATLFKSTVRRTIVCGEVAPAVSGTDLELTSFISDWVCESQPTYQIRLINCCHEMELKIFLSDPNSSVRKVKMAIKVPVCIASPNVHRHNAPKYTDDPATSNHYYRLPEYRAPQKRPIGDIEK